MNSLKIKTFFVSLFLLSTNLIYAVDFQPEVAAGAILNSPAVAQLMNVGRYFIIIIFFVLLAKNMFKLIAGQGSPDWFGLVAKFMIIFFLYNNAVWVVTTFTNKIIVSTEVAETTRVSEAFSRLDVSLVELAMGNPEQLEAAKEKGREGSVLPDAVTDTFIELSRVFSIQMVLSMILSVIIKGLLTISLMTKYLMIDIFWPIFFQLVVVGFVFAVPFASFEGGMDSIKKFGINMVEVAMWPIIYSLAFNLTIDSMVGVIDSFVAMIALPPATGNIADTIASSAARVLSDIPLVANLIAHLVFLIGLGFLTPLFARMIVRNESVGVAASAVTYSTGSQLMNMASQAGGAAGHALASTGKSMMGMTSKGASEAAKAGASGAGSAVSGAGGSGGGSGGSESSGGSSGGPSGSSGGGSGASESSGGSKITSDLAGDGGGSGGRAAHGGKGFYNAPNLSKDENKAMNSLSGNSDAKSEFGKLQGMRKDGYNSKAIDNQISNINSKFGTNLKKSGEK